MTHSRIAPSTPNYGLKSGGNLLARATDPKIRKDNRNIAHLKSRPA